MRKAGPVINPIPLTANQSRRLEDCASRGQSQNSRSENEAVPLEDAYLFTAQQESVWELGRVAERQEASGDHHVVRIGLISRAIAETMGLESARVKALTLAAPLHDVGMIGIPDRIFMKKECLSPSETAVMRWHCWIGAKILRDESALRTIFLRCRSPERGIALLPGMNRVLLTAASIALAHHEKWDGTGYPRELQGEEIPLESRIVAIADVYDALTSDRPFRRAYTEEWALEALDERAGNHFDPDVYATFLSAFSRIRSLRLEYPDQP
jgi:putative two-component system response regulator